MYASHPPTTLSLPNTLCLNSNRTVAERRYFYDANGIISSAKVYYYGYNGTTCTEFDFFFKTNIQGDVLAVYNASGTEVMKITYDAWGNFTDTVSTMPYPPSTEQLQALAIPFRYRGYVYDQETGFYYLNSRYYDPVMHKFLNADALVSTGQGLLGNNMYAYCNNNPVMYVDPNGNWPEWIEKWITDFENYDKNNTDIDKVYHSNHFSSYNGTLVIRHSIDGLGSWAIFGTIFLSHDEDGLVDDGKETERENTLKHEYGHILQEKEFGTGRYLFEIALPSVIFCALYNKSDFIKNNYYNLPWEHDADRRMGIVREGHKAWAPIIADIYLSLWEAAYEKK